MPVIKDRILYPPSGVQVEPKLIDLESNIGEEVLKRFRYTLEQHGDYDWLINGPYDLTGTTSTCGVQRKRISEIEFQARQVSRAFYQNGLRKGDVVHFVIPNNTEYHITVIGAWICEATVSLGDPGLSLKVMETQLKDTQAKFVICFDGSRKVVYEALKNLQFNCWDKFKSWFWNWHVQCKDKINPSLNQDFNSIKIFCVKLEINKYLNYKMVPYRMTRLLLFFGLQGPQVYLKESSIVSNISEKWYQITKIGAAKVLCLQLTYKVLVTSTLEASFHL